MSCFAAAYAENKADLVANYRIAARYNLADKSVDGRETLTWTNSSTSDVPDLEFHLYMNAFKNEKSTFVRESGGQLRGDRLEKDKSPWGWIDVKRMSMAGTDLTPAIAFIHPDDTNADDQTVVRVPLAKPVKPGETIEIEIEFTTKFPKVFARTGYAGTFLLAGQWFPKVGVWEKAGMRYATKAGWNCHQFHANSEFYADYGRYDVDLTVPANEVIGATGELVKRVDNAADNTVTYTFHQENVHDFAWTIQPDYVKIERIFRAEREVSPQELQAEMKRHSITADEARLTDVKVTVLLQPEHVGQAERHFKAAFTAIKWFGLWYGHYPHRTLTIVDPPHNGNGAGGMEYPTFITAGTAWFNAPNDGLVDEVVVHEFGHQFWQGQVGTNEFEAAWMDEGFNTYSTGKVMDLAYGRREVPLIRCSTCRWDGFGRSPRYNSLEENRAVYIGIGPKQDDMFRFAWQYRNASSYGNNSYFRPGLMMSTLENLLGSDIMERVMRTYQQRYRYRNPAAPDFIRTVNEVAGRDMGWYFQQTVYSSNVIDYKVDGVSSKEIKPFRGVFDKGDAKVTVTPDDAEKVEKDEAKKRKDSKQEPEYLSKIYVSREGEGVMPVDIRIVFKNGEVVNEKWDGAYRWVKFEYIRRSEVKQVEVDPKHKLELDVNFANNSWTAEPDESVTFKWASTLLFWVQNILHLASVVG